MCVVGGGLLGVLGGGGREGRNGRGGAGGGERRISDKDRKVRSSVKGGCSLSQLSMRHLRVIRHSRHTHHTPTKEPPHYE
jgi:hypothetical protein